MQIFDIIQGHTNELLNLNEELSKSRLKICYRCPIYSKRLGGMCNNRLWLNPNTGDVSVNKKEGYIRGCGCRLSPKTRLPNAKCPVGKW